MSNKYKNSDVRTNMRLTPDIDELLRAAKRATGASFKFLITEAVRSKYAKFAPRLDETKKAA